VKESDIWGWLHCQHTSINTVSPAYILLKFQMEIVKDKLHQKYLTLMTWKFLERQQASQNNNMHQEVLLSRENVFDKNCPQEQSHTTSVFKLATEYHDGHSLVHH
jgi:hypothetical protein